MILNDFPLRFSTELRSFLRSVGILRYIIRARAKFYQLCGKTNYEFAFNKALQSAIRRGDIVWDVGANVGLYTTQFSNLAGAAGSVYAFEPAPACFKSLENCCKNMRNVKLFNMALGLQAGTLPLAMADDPLGATHTLISRENSLETNNVNVTVASGDQFIRENNLPIPRVIKIDVEGFEEEVLNGLHLCLQNPQCRAIFCEVHFSLLQARGERQAPSRIQKLLKQSGFQVKWLDASHIAAYRLD